MTQTLYAHMNKRKKIIKQNSREACEREICKLAYILLSDRINEQNPREIDQYLQ
jgi:hypothetical protein